MRPQLLIAAATLLITLPATAQEVETLGTHPVAGQDAQGPFQGTVQIDSRARVVLRRNHSGAVTVQRGRASVDRKQLVLLLDTPAASTTIRLSRADTRTHIAWEQRRGKAWLRVTMNKKETPAEMARRVLDRPGAMKWLTNYNRGWVDREARLARQRLPTATQIAAFARDGGATILSLNGSLRGEQSSWKDPKTGQRERVQLPAFIRSRGLTHVTIGMSASRAPTDAELVKVFRVLLDPRRRPLLMHCKGGSDRTGIIGALYRVEFLGASKADAKAEMRRHMWAARSGTEIQGVYLDLYQRGRLRRLLEAAKVKIPARYGPSPSAPRNRRSRLSQPL